MTSCARCTWRPDRDLTCERHGQRIPARLQLIWHAADKAHEMPEGDVRDSMIRDDALRVLKAERADHADWHVCRTFDGPGATDFCVDAEDIGVEPCPLYVALGTALSALDGGAPSA